MSIIIVLSIFGTLVGNTEVTFRCEVVEQKQIHQVACYIYYDTPLVFLALYANTKN
jgi:hypothetical protein